ncbi:hypothetical protein INH39_01245 [Massilia violaceinigra]|uniref:Uncharacterized protein n=1 Tax=Massilia violaceinigra TaxID=2045208 RepID=A0ABY4A9Z5_9BURK|nr:hypothetical protein [Massilia violaceinigra]UOD30416.1 hypothetical protein INH39_01245 [Massilia violaceinigra]
MGSASIVVVGADIDDQLAKYQLIEHAYHTNKCIVWVDMLPEAKAEYAASEGFLRHVDGGLHPPLDWSFWVDRLALDLPALPDTFAPVDIPPDERVLFLEFVRLRYASHVIAPGEHIDWREESLKSWARVGAEGEVLELVTPVIPKGRWYYWHVGSRRGTSTGHFRLKPGGSGTRDDQEPRVVDFADATTKGDIDFASMREECGRKAAMEWDIAHAAGGAMSWEPLRTMLEKHDGDVAPALLAYWSQAKLLAIGAAFCNPAHDPPNAYRDNPTFLANRVPCDSQADWFGRSREDHIASGRDRLFDDLEGFVVDGELIGPCGEWQPDGDEHDDLSFEGERNNRRYWNRRYNALLDALPDATLVTYLVCQC